MGKGNKQRKRGTSILKGISLEAETLISTNNETKTSKKKTRVASQSKTPPCTRNKPDQTHSVEDCIEETSSTVFLSYFTATFTVLLLVLMIHLALRLRELRTAVANPRESEICIPCKYLRSSEVTWSEGYNEARCCGEASLILQEMIAKSAEQRYEDESRQRYYDFSFPGCNKAVPDKPAVRVSGITTSRQQESELDARICWNTTSFQTGETLRHVNDSVVVGESAIYHISFQVTLAVTSDSPDITYRTRVMKTSENTKKDVVLVESTKSPCHADDGGYVTSASGAIFRLEKGDVVFVTTSHPDNLHPSDEQIFLTIHRLQ